MDINKIFVGLQNWRTATTGGAAAAALALAQQIASGQLTWQSSIPYWIGVIVLALWPELQKDLPPAPPTAPHQ